MLDKIIARKHQELAAAKVRRPQESILDGIEIDAVPSFVEALNRPALNIIAEVKYCSPSHGPFKCQRPPEEVAREYSEGGAAAISVLTDESFFKGSLEYLQRIARSLRNVPNASEEEEPRAGTIELKPLLRKDFILDRYQVAEARAAGASAFLLIVACLNRGQLEGLAGFGAELGLDALVEVHDLYELETALNAGSTIIGVNNRNLRTFEVDIRTSFDIARRLEGETEYALVSESGLSDRSQLLELRDAGFSAFLIGTSFMETESPGEALARFLEA